MPLTCPRCQKVFKFPSEHCKHLLSNFKQNTNQDNKLLFECNANESEKSFARKKVLQAHKRIHTDQALICTIDNMKCATKHSLNKHLLVHADKKLIQCAVCGNKYRQPTNLRTRVKNAHNYSVSMNKENKCEYSGHAQSSLVGLHHHLLEDHAKQVQEQEDKIKTKGNALEERRHPLNITWQK